MRDFILKFALVFLMSISSASLYAQGCAACKTNAAQSGAEAQRGLRRGIAVLLIPSLIIFSGVVVLAYVNRNSSEEQKRAGVPRPGENRFPG
jgi:hypothetical protein